MIFLAPSNVFTKSTLPPLRVPEILCKDFKREINEHDSCHALGKLHISSFCTPTDWIEIILYNCWQSDLEVSWTFKKLIFKITFSAKNHLPQICDLLCQVE